ncbi:uncharacterized protein HMPREF1541_07078 [Cyphellophora europaea CBS 101466]|uniref:Aspartate racemase n=1 Tax=Cyphellophora europaea (strain CBS 101466) TaxID=1220924 RepID=W2RR97_CYPE1|nr:uncharacterized protein HMPREF1541_07078 [Cyphellophora europaea CBS 101466]ETN39036.1 hypothetical protein HMPREF1541_07078 [Cyphellophora europaea CBS 101466]
MKTIALLGGMTPDVTALYYNIINEHIRAQLGQRHSAKIYIYSVNLEEQLQRVQEGKWDEFAAEYISAVQPLASLEQPRVQGVALGAIIAHKVSKQIADALPPVVPFLDVTEFVAKELRRLGITTVGLIGPAVTMTDDSPDFFIGKLKARHGITVLVPDTDAEIQEVNRGMFQEVVRGPAAVTEQTRTMFKEAAWRLVGRGAGALILGSTDLGFVIQEQDLPGVPVLDAAKVHAVGLAEWSITE